MKGEEEEEENNDDDDHGHDDDDDQEAMKDEKALPGAVSGPCTSYPWRPMAPARIASRHDVCSTANFPFLRLLSLGRLFLLGHSTARWFPASSLLIPRL